MENSDVYFLVKLTDNSYLLIFKDYPDQPYSPAILRRSLICFDNMDAKQLAFTPFFAE